VLINRVSIYSGLQHHQDKVEKNIQVDMNDIYIHESLFV
jgi:hypothetical protein